MLNRLKRLWRKLFPLPMYVVIYDIPADGDWDGEEYYGYFSSIESAEQMFIELAAGRGYTNAKICRVVKNLEEELYA